MSRHEVHSMNITLCRTQVDKNNKTERIVQGIEA